MVDIYDDMMTLAACLRAQIEADGSPMPCFTGLLPGDTVLGFVASECDEDADDCGMAWLRLSGYFPSEDILNPTIRPGNCSVTLSLQIEMGIQRCITVIQEDGTGPSNEELEDATRQQYKDAETMRRALVCCNDLPSKEWILGTYSPIGPDGGWVGGTWTMALGA